jgi:lipid A 3-O-deacylase
MGIRILGLLILISFRGLSQPIDSIYAYQSFHLTWENDIFTATDRYYSQGLFLQYEHHNLDLKWLNPFFLRVPDIERTLKSGIDQRGYTPSTIQSDTFLKGDRPYAATITYGNQFFSRSLSRNYVLNWSVFLGFIGKPAFGEYTQKTIHKWIDSPQPKGWEYQLNTGFIMDLNMGYTKLFFTRSRWIRLELGDLLTIGNLTNDMRIHGGLKLGYIGNRKQFYLYYTPELRIVAYDGTLRGAIFVKPSEAALPAGVIERFVSEQQIGIYLRYKPFYATAHFHYQSRLFKDAMNHMWGGISIGYMLWDNYNK